MFFPVSFWFWWVFWFAGTNKRLDLPGNPYSSGSSIVVNVAEAADVFLVVLSYMDTSRQLFLDLTKS